MQYRQLGQSGFSVSVLSFGAWQLGDSEYWGASEESDPQAAVDAALDLGINLFDTAEMYGEGESERVLGQVLGKRSSEVYIASKISPEHCMPGKVRGACEASLHRLDRDYIDIYQIHWPFSPELFADVYAELETLRDEGKIREIGLSNFGIRDLTDWMDIGAAVSNQLGYNLLFRAVEYRIIPECRKYGLGVLVYMPLMQGLLAGVWRTVSEIPMLRRRTRHFSSFGGCTRHGEQGCEELLMQTLSQLREFADAIHVPPAIVSLCWVAAQPGVTSVVIGARNPDQVCQNAQAADLNIGPAAVAQLNEITAPLKRQLGSNADMWKGSGSSRIS